MEQNQPVQTQMTPKAIAIIILGITTFIFGWCAIIPIAGLVFGLIGIILGIVTISLSGSSGKALAANPTLYHGQGLRKTGKIFGIIGFIFSIIFFLVWLVLIIIGGTSGYNLDRMF
jgi:hypothetical protein